jgi:D-alanyl-D-alanine carboxypeptidase
VDAKRGCPSRAVAGVMAALLAGVILADATPASALPPATVTLHLAATVTVPGRCDDATVTVFPDKTGQHVTVQRLVGSMWTVLVTATLGAGSTVTVPLCFGWGALGTVPLRSAWQSDGVNAGDTSPRIDLLVRRAPWMIKVEQLASGHSMSISIADAGLSVYRRSDTIGRRPASNEKLLLSMALLRRLGPDAQMTTDAAAVSVSGGVVQGNLWLLGHGDPGITNARLSALAQHVKDAGITQITGHVMGSTGYFSHDWFAPGWKQNFPKDEVAMPTALTFNRNTANGVHITDPERRAAAALAQRLRAMGVQVGGPAGMGAPPGGLHTIATIISAKLSTLIRPMDVYSLNFDAEVLGKRLAVARYGPPGTIAKGAAVIHQFAASNAVNATAHDASGLSYSNYVSAVGIVTLLRYADTTPWLSALRQALPEAGQGTLTGRLSGVRVHAKTGTLDGISALSGWVWIEQEGRWADFSMLSSGNTTSLKHLEDAILRVVAAHGP